MREQLEEDLKREGIHKVMFDMAPWKSPILDGNNLKCVALYKTCGGILTK